MKKIFGLLPLLLIFATQSTAQDFQKYKIAFLVEPNVAWLVPQNQNLKSAGSSLRFGFGLSTDIHFTKNYAIGTGFKIITNGGRLSYYKHETLLDANDIPVEYIVQRERDYKMKYVEIPITLKLRTNEIGYITYWGQFGFGLSANISAKGDDKDFYALTFDENSNPSAWVIPTRADDKTDNVDISNDIGFFRASLIIGGGIEYNLSGSTSIVVGVTFDNGFTDVLKGNGVEEKAGGIPSLASDGPKTFKMKAFSNSVGLTLGILF